MMDDVLKRIDALAPEYAKAKADSYQLQEFKKTQRAMLYGSRQGALGFGKAGSYQNN